MAEKKTMRQQQAAETRMRLLGAAERLFAEKGYNATPVRKINQSIGMADGLLYHYFPGGKKEILQVLVKDKFEQIVMGLRVRAQGLDELPIEEAIERVYQNWVAVFTEHQDVIKILFKENEVMHLIERDQLAGVVRGGELWFPAFLRKRASRGEIIEMDYGSATEVLMAVLMSHFLALLTGAGSGLLSDCAQRKKLIAYQVGLWKPPQP